MKVNITFKILLLLFITSCVGTSSQGIFGTGVSIALDPRSIGTQIDDNIMQKNLSSRLLLKDKKYVLSINTKVLDGRIFITGKVEDPEEKLQITKMAWETNGVRSVKNNIIIKEEFNFKQSAKDLLITSQLRTAMIVNKKIKSTNYNIDTYKKKIYIYGIAQDKDEMKQVIQEAKSILDVDKVVASILLVEASSNPTLAPSASSARARFTAVVDFPTPPLPLATNTMFFTWLKPRP